MKLLLDEMFSQIVAVQLRSRGHDVLAVTERADLRGQRDNELIESAHQENRAIVTENSADFRRLTTDRARGGRRHSGLIYTTNRGFPRQHPRAIGRLVSALDRFLSEDPPEGDSWERWLA